MILLDTDVCIEILRGNEAVIGRREATLDDVATTWVTAAELSFGAAKSRAPERNQMLVAEFLNTLPVLDMEYAAAECFGRIKAELEQGGKRLADADLFIAAIALTRGATLATGNRRHYGRIPHLRMVDWLRPE